MLTPALLPRLQALLAEAGLDGWLLYDFRGSNAIAQGLLGFEGMVSRRIFALVPREGTPVGIAHAIEPGPWAHWPAEWPLRRYTGWRALGGRLVRQGGTLLLELRAPVAVDRGVTPSPCVVYEAAFREALCEVAGVEGAVDHVQCRVRGDDRCEWRVDWRRG